MSYLKLFPNGQEYGIREYGGLGNLRRAVARNDDSFEEFINLGNRPLPNQNPLVQFLLEFSVDVEWTEKYLISVINQKADSVSRACGFTSIYSRGKNHIKSLFPESNHNTLIAVPFDSNPSSAHIDGYFNNELNTLVPFFPIYTTDVIQRFDITALLNTVTYKANSDIYTVVQVDPYALVIGYWRWLKLNRFYGNSPHGFLSNFPLMNFYNYHNELVSFNYLNDNASDISVQKGSFNLEVYWGMLKDFTTHKNNYMKTEQMYSFTNFIQINKVINIDVDLRKMVFPNAGKSGLFTQINWVWTLATLGLVNKYLYYMNFMGAADGGLKDTLKDYFRDSLNSQLAQIKDDRWNKHFFSLYNEVKNKL